MKTLRKYESCYGAGYTRLLPSAPLEAPSFWPLLHCREKSPALQTTQASTFGNDEWQRILSHQPNKLKCIMYSFGRLFSAKKNTSVAPLRVKFVAKTPSVPNKIELQRQCSAVPQYRGAREYIASFWTKFGGVTQKKPSDSRCTHPGGCVHRDEFEGV